MYPETMLAVVLTILNLCIGIEACPSISGCNFDKGDCTSLSCQKTIGGITVSLSIKLDTCKTDVTATITLRETSLGLSFTHTFKGEGDVPVPGLSLGVASVNIRVKIYRKDTNLILEVSLVGKTLLTGETSFSVVKNDLGKFSRGFDCGLSAWFSDQSAGIKAVIIGSVVVVVLGIIGCIICCCRCCCKRDNNRVATVASQPEGLVVMQTMPQTLPQVA